MLSSIKSIIDKKRNGITITSNMLNLEIEYISKTLEIMRDAQRISNDAYLDSGSIQGGLTVVSSLLEQNIPDTEIDSLMQTLNFRAINLEDKYPGLNAILESYRP